ncbi:hypothetical protein [uncultured Fibrobacter sp.]|uniref:nickel/cobalt transporter n=1 Tax=uncultured Fibrobacter sp. TaxID=261512 RepID=UPI002804E985|nr:hypothetical protein [uncultured Fibrobacter sp.]
MFAIKKQIKILSILFLCLCGGISFSFADASVKKFEFKKAEPTQEIASDADTATVKTSKRQIFFGSDKMLQQLTEWQKSLRENISGQIRKLKVGHSGSVFLFLLICFAYGFIHAIGPGHGKTIVVSYFLARRGNVAQGIGLGTAITTIHTLSAVILLFILYGIAKTALFPIFDTSRINIEKASYILIAFTGILLIFIAVREWIHGRKNAPANMHASWKELLWLALITGIVPCPAVALIVFFCLLNDLPGLALLGAFGICLGMAITNTAFGFLAIATRRGIDKGIQRAKQLERYAVSIHSCIALIGGLCIFLFGIFLLLGA